MHCENCQQLGLQVLARSCRAHGSMYQRATLQVVNIENHETRASVRWVSAGNYTYEVDGRKFQLSQGTYLLLNHGRRYNARIRSNDADVQSHTLSFDQTALNDVYQNISVQEERLLDNFCHRENFQHGFFENQFYQNHSIKHKLACFEQLRNPLSNGDEWFSELLFEIMLSQLTHNHRIRRLPSARLATRKEVYRRLLLVYEWLHDDPAKQANLDQLANMAAMSPFHFLRSFKRAFGQAPHQMQLKLRVEKAKALMQTQAMPITELAFSLGFEDLSSFSHAFKKATGSSPSTYLKT